MEHCSKKYSAIASVLNGEGEGDDAVLAPSAGIRSSEALIESETPCHDAQWVRYSVGSYRVSNPFHLTVLVAKSEDYITAPQHLHFNLNFNYYL